MNKLISKFAAIFSGLIGIVSGLIAIQEYIKQNYTFAYIWTSVGIFFMLLLVLLISLVVSENFRNTVYQQIRYYFSFLKCSYRISELKKVYKFTGREHIDYFVTNSIISNIKGLDTFSDKFRWSKHLTANEVKKKLSTDSQEQHILNVRRVHNFHEYTIGIPTLSKGEALTITMKLEALLDDKHESEPFLSSGITCQTKKLVLLVAIPKELVFPNAEFCIYSNYHDTAPISREDLNYDDDIGGFRIMYNKPIIGYRYVISWKYK